MKSNKLLRLGVLLFIVFLISTIPDTSYAVYIPKDDFYLQHSSECVTDGRSYSCMYNSCTVFDNPESKKQIKSFTGSTQFLITVSYTDKDSVKWGLIEYLIDPNIIKTGWVQMQYFKVIYDEISFREEYANEIKEYNGEFDYIQKLYKTNAYTYPNSNTIHGINYDLTSNNFKMHQLYTDKNNQLWIYVTTYSVKGWIKFDKNTYPVPSNTIPQINPAKTIGKTPLPNITTQPNITIEHSISTAPGFTSAPGITTKQGITNQPAIEPTFKTQMPIPPLTNNDNPKNVWIVGGLIAFVAASTVVLFSILLKKKRV